MALTHPGGEGGDDRPAFTTKGRISAQAACEQIIDRIEPKDGITVAQAIDDVTELCEFTHGRDTVIGAMRSASEAMLGRGEKGVISTGPGWVRMDDAAAISYARDRARRAVRQVKRSATAAEAADTEALTWEDRQSRDHYLRARDLTAGIQERRTRRLRSAPPLDES